MYCCPHCSSSSTKSICATNRSSLPSSPLWCLCACCHLACTPSNNANKRRGALFLIHSSRCAVPRSFRLPSSWFHSVLYEFSIFRPHSHFCRRYFSEIRQLFNKSRWSKSLLKWDSFRPHLFIRSVNADPISKWLLWLFSAHPFHGSVVFCRVFRV